MATKSEKRRIELAFPFIQLYFLIKGKAVSQMDHHLGPIEKEIEKILDEQDQKKRRKLDSRIARLNIESGIRGQIADSVGGQKFLLTIFSFVQCVNDHCELYFPRYLEDIFNKFLDVEYELNQSDKVALKIRKSAEKQGKKLFAKIQGLGYYQS